MALGCGFISLVVSVAIGPQGASAQIAVLDESWLPATDCEAVRDPISVEALDEVTFVPLSAPTCTRAHQVRHETFSVGRAVARWPMAAEPVPDFVFDQSLPDEFDT